MTGEQLDLEGSWTVGKRLGSGGFGEVYEVVADGRKAAAKFVPKAPGSDRELLFVDLPDATNVVPVIDDGEHDDFWVLVMPLAEKSLRQHLDSSGGRLELAGVVEVLMDVGAALEDLEGRVVHRDLKPENVLLVDGVWCLADFGIARYAEASTAPDTQKFAMSPPYAAPERWRYETATSATDVYAIGVMAYEALTGTLPFPGPGVEDYRDQHLHHNPPSLEEVPAGITALVDECLFKAPGARPSASNLRARLENSLEEPSTGGLAALAAANREQVSRLSESERAQSEAQSATERRSELAEAGRASFLRISEALSNQFTAAAPSSEFSGGRAGAWEIGLGGSQLILSAPKQNRPGEWGGWEAPSFDVVLSAGLSLRFPPNRTEYQGRSHSLWYCDATTAGDFAWYETAFMISPMIPRRGRQEPFALDPGEEAAKAVGSGIAEFQLAWPFNRLDIGELDEFVDRWAGWLALAADGQLGYPSHMPERSGAEESFRRD